MANIIRVDYEAMPRQAASMRAHGKELNAELTAAYKSIGDMHSAWYGKRYNSLVQEFNNLIPSINELLTLVVDEIPYTLETVANNYALTDRGSQVVKAVKEVPTRISDLPLSNDVGMRFLTSEVTTVQQTVSKNFQNARDKMNSIEAEYARISWESEASQAFKVKFTNLKKQIISSFENLNTQFTTLMNQTKEDIEKTESASTVQ